MKDGQQAFFTLRIWTIIELFIFKKLPAVSGSSIFPIRRFGKDPRVLESRYMASLSGFKNLFTANDMTVGTPWKGIARFAFPMLIGNFAQQLYNTVDAVVVGRSKWGYTALAAVGNALPILNLLLALFVGVATGAGILVAQYYGAKSRERLEHTIENCIIISFAAGLVIMIAGPLLTGPMLRAVHTLPEVYDACRNYLNIFFIGIFGFMFYNIFAGILRGLGDSFSALLFLIICAGLNVIGDLLLVGKMGVPGVALATVLSQAISAVLCLWKILRMQDVFTLRLKNIRPRKEYIVRIIRLGIPSGITQAIISGSMLVVQSLINSFGDAMFVAANVMVMRVDGYAMLPNFSFGMAMGTYAGQNVGAGKMDRLKTGTRQGTLMTVVTALVLVPVIILCGPYLMDLFAPGNTELINLAMSMMYILALGYIAVGVSQSLQGVIRGAGDTTSPMWITIATTVLIRIPLAYGLVYLAQSLGKPLLTQEKMVFVSLLAVWLMGAVITIIVYCRGSWRKLIPEI